MGPDADRGNRIRLVVGIDMDLRMTMGIDLEMEPY